MSEKTTRQALRDVAERIMASGELFTYAELWMSLPPQTEVEPSRLADQCIQRWRRRGWISNHRVGRNTYWRLTDAGREALANG